MAEIRTILTAKYEYFSSLEANLNYRSFRPIICVHSIDECTTRYYTHCSDKNYIVRRNIAIKRC
ncbi:Hypothetical protein CINCED_3A025481 [Cinara cedri]|uniref:Uncharacterized protein n=1 Tax=Cinara cedri TaxID=506608 RepID=A0A5E4NEC5_9HEMI|nr:Hypothetical protein CINCED_3A025481 [Cinara cedri]